LEHRQHPMADNTGKEMRSLANFDESDPRAFLNSPRSLQACKHEGVLPSELVYKPIEAFQERALSPRLVKLRYDFFEAKRRDLFAVTRRARDTMIAESRNNDSSRLDIIARESGVSRSAILALNSDGLQQERQKLLKAQQREKTWLQNALGIELNNLKFLENANTILTEQGNNDAEKLADNARKMKAMNDKRALDEEKKSMETEARARLEKQIAKEEFEKHLEELKRKGERDAIEQKRAYERQVAAAEGKREAEREKERKREQAYMEQEAKREEMRAQDLRRLEVLESQKKQMQEEMNQKLASRDLRIGMSMAANMEAESRRREEFEERCRQEDQRQERLAQAKALDQEESAKKAFMTMMKRKVIAEEAARKLEERRQAILDSQEETEYRLLEHEQKKERYLDFKRELDGLRGKNKEINVSRQRRREEAHREHVAEQVRSKDEKIEIVNAERNRMRELRRQGQSEAFRARELVKSEIMRQRITSKFNSKVLEKKLTHLLKNDMFTEKALLKSDSAPLLRSVRAAQQATMESSA